jgi:acetolactate synthase I/II/III large subunit
MDALPMKNNSSGPITGSEALLQCLLYEGVDTLFGYPGGAIMPVYDALHGYADRLRHILVRHEQGAIHAAQGYARVSGKTGVVFATSGPGATNLVTGLADAMIDSTPLVCITGQVFEHLLGTDAFQEVDVVNISLPVTKWNVQVTDASDLPAAIARAFYIARSGRPGPVVVDITKNAQVQRTEGFTYSPCTAIRTYKPKPVPDLTALEEAAALINQAQRPYILAGQGILLSEAGPALQALTDKTGIPVACTLLGLSALPTHHPHYVGYLGMHGNYAPNVLTNACDVLIAIGMRFDDRVTGNVAKYARQAKIIHIEIDKAEINKIIPADVAVHADAREALELLLPMVRPNTHSPWLGQFREMEKEEFEKVIQEATQPTEGGLRMAEVVASLAQATQGEAVLVTDVGQHQMVASRYFPFRHPRTNITSGGAGTMGFALPAAMGATLVSSLPVVAVIGDGGFQMTVQELGTIMQYRLPVKILILNNSFLGMVRQWQELFFQGRYSFTEMENPDFVALTLAYRIPARKVEAREHLHEAIRWMLQTEGPCLLEAVVEKEENVFPMVPAGAGVSEIILEAPKPIVH